ncbi:MAG: RHS repeat-associated core domain-containing protein, partial [Chloroflexota bacterium]
MCNDFIGLGRIAQQGESSTEYFLGDALGSVRQLVDGDGVVRLAKSYEPYGDLMDSAGSGESAFGFTGEMQWGGFMYLRARFYAPRQGRFLSRDSWEGDYEQPMSYNAWLYAYANPITLIDPSGNVPLPTPTNPLLGPIPPLDPSGTSAPPMYLPPASTLVSILDPCD